MHKKITLIWFRRNLRLADNAVLHTALAQGLPLAGVFAVHRPSETANPRCTLFHHQAAAELSQGLAAHGIPMFAVQGGAAENIIGLALRLNAQAVLADEGAMPSEILQDNHIWRLLDQHGIPFKRISDRTVFGKTELPGEYGRPYRDFARYRQTWLNAFQQGTSMAAPAENPAIPVQTAFLPLPSFPDAAALGHGQTALPQWGGETVALRLWRQFLSNLELYPLLKDFPAKKASSHLSAYLAAGCLSPRMLAREAARLGADEWLDNLIKRDFYLQHAFQPAPDAAPAVPEPPDEEFFLRWSQGNTGFPLIDAAMRCLKHSGWLAPALRQEAAAFWCGTLRQHWQHGAAWFAAQQTDHDDAINQGNWQAAALPGVHLVANPLLRSQQLDPDGTFIRRHVPELAHLPKDLIHTPWLAGADIDRHGYPLPLLEAV